MELDPALPWRDIRGEGFNAYIGPVRFARASDSEFKAALKIRDVHINVGGVCHGGVLMSVADLAMGAGAFASGEDHPCATISFDAQFLSAAKHGTWLVAHARRLRRVRELCFMEAELWSEGRQVMQATGIWKYLASRRPGTPGKDPTNPEG